MVYNTARHIKIPFSNTKMTSHTGRVYGQGMGSILLQTGGAGGASSYSDMDDYISTTGINPYARTGMESSGTGLKSLSDKLSKLNIEPKLHVKRKNITMSF
jgi:hypothetical protein